MARVGRRATLGGLGALCVAAMVAAAAVPRAAPPAASTPAAPPALRSGAVVLNVAAGPPKVATDSSVAAHPGPQERVLRAGPKVTCVGNGTDGKRVELVYARRSDMPDRYASTVSELRGWATTIDQTLYDSAQKTGGVRRARWVTDSSCNPTVLNEVVPNTVTDFSGLVSALQGAGLTSATRKYLVAWDDDDSVGTFCGLGEVMDDDTAGSTNQNETQPVGAMFGAIETSCWDGHLAAHEFMHTLGAVQPSAPNATQHNHCTDGSDVMCYPDAAGVVIRQVCPADQAELYDCNNDDYFNTNPPDGSYLKTHWNTASSGWLDPTGSQGPPYAPQGVTVTPADGSLKVSWSAPAFDGGSPILGYVVTVSPGGRTVAVNGNARSATVTGLADGSSYTANVVAVGKLGTSPAEAGGSALPAPLVKTTATDANGFRDSAPAPDGGLYLAASSSIEELSTAGTLTTVVSGTPTSPVPENTTPLTTPVNATHLAVAANGDLYWYDQAVHGIRRLHAGRVNTVAGNGTTTDSGDGYDALSAGVGDGPLAVLPDGSVLTADSKADVVRQFTAGGDIERVAGLTNKAGATGDGGPALSATLDDPQDLAVDPNGNVYVADYGNNLIRRFAVGGTMATVAGTGGTSYSSTNSLVATSATTPYPNTIAWGPGHLLVNDGGEIRELVGTNLVRFAGAPFTSGAPTADGTAATTISYMGDGSYLQRIDWANNTLHVLLSAKKTLSWSDRAAGPWLTTASPSVPDASPSAPVASAGVQKATVAWAPPGNGGSTITSYTITPSGGAPVVSAPAGATSATVSGLTAGTTYTFTVTANNAKGAGAASAASNPVTPSAPPPYSPFSSWAALVARQFQDLLGRAPTSSESSTWVTALSGNTKTVGDLDDSLRRSSASTGTVDPVTRLYQAYFLRIPDEGGLTYWIGRRRAGVSLPSISNTFAASSEFKGRYGSVSDAAFVNLVYTNVLGRPGEASGVAYWTTQLTSKKQTRGQVMVGFSESAEYKTAQQADVDGGVAYILLLGRAPTTSELATWTRAESAGTTDASLLTSLLKSPAYASHVG